MAASQRSIQRFLPVYAHSNSNTILTMNAAISIGSMPANDRGVINDEQPRIRRMLNTFDPKILPSAN